MPGQRSPTMIHKAVIAVLAFCVLATTAAFFTSTEYHFGYWGRRTCAVVALGGLTIGFGGMLWGPGWIWNENDIVDPIIGLPGVSSSDRFPVIHIPLWLLFVLFSVSLTIAFIRGPLQRRRRRERGECVECGYNLTGLPEPRCPECGTRIE